MMQPNAESSEFCSLETHGKKDRPVSDERLEKIANEMSEIKGQIKSFDKSQDEMKEWLKELSRATNKMGALEQQIAGYQRTTEQLHHTIDQMQDKQNETDRKFNDLLKANAEQNSNHARTDGRAALVERVLLIFLGAAFSGAAGFTVYQFQ